ncbi:MAG: hypothetical protein JKY08_10275 [Flavobacteriaceae bacterium]|nr:hypothetical protein [Flavobacteriaceae bacterium]
MKKILIFYSLLLLICPKIFAQDKNNIWVIGLGTTAVDFYPTNESEVITGNPEGLGNQFFNVNDHWNKFGIPKINISRYLWKRFSADISFSMHKINKIGNTKIRAISYQSLDGGLQFSILKDNYKFYPYISVGGGYTWLDKKRAGTFNGGLGITYWFSDQFGINAMGLYKTSPEKHPQVLQHLNYAASIVFRFGSKQKEIDCLNCLKKEIPEKLTSDKQ